MDEIFFRVVSRMDIDVSEALCGMKRTIKTLDGRHIVLTSAPGEVIKQADVKMIKGEGMPTYRDPFNKGKMIIIFNITYPDKIDPAVAKKISSLLPAPKNVPPIPKDGEEVHLEEFDGRFHKSVSHVTETLLELSNTIFGPCN